MRTVVLGYGFLAAMMVEASAFQAIGKSWPGFWTFFLRVIVISIPLIGIWTAIIAGNVIAAVFGYLWITRTLKKIDLKEVPVH